MNKISRLFRWTLLVVALAGCSSLLAGSDDQAIIAGTRKYLAAESAITDVKITVEKVEGDYARVTVTPKDNQTEAALVFLKRKGSVWHGLTMGTGFDPEDLAKLHIPAGLRP